MRWEAQPAALSAARDSEVCSDTTAAARHDSPPGFHHDFRLKSRGTTLVKSVPTRRLRASQPAARISSARCCSKQAASAENLMESISEPARSGDFVCRLNLFTIRRDEKNDDAAHWAIVARTADARKCGQGNINLEFTRHTRVEAQLIRLPAPILS